MNPCGRQGLELALVMALSVGVAAAFVAAGRFDLVTDPGATVIVDEQFSGTQKRSVGARLVMGEWEPNADGLGLRPGRTGVLEIQVPNAPERRLVAVLYGKGGPGLRVTGFVSGDGLVYRETFQQTLTDQIRVDLTPAAVHWERVWIKLFASVDRNAGQADPAVLMSLRVVSLWRFSLPNVPIALLLILTPWLAYVVWSERRPERAFAYSLAVLLALAVQATLTWPSGEPPIARWWEVLFPFLERNTLEGANWFLLAYFALLGFGVWGPRQSDSADVSRRWTCFALAGIIAWGGSFRLEQLVKLAWLPLDPDAQLYRSLAESMTSLYDTSWREPLWIWLLKVWFWFSGDSVLSLRLLTVVLSLAAVLVAYKLFRDYTGQPVVGLLVAALLCQNPYLVRLSVRGLKEEAYMIAILTLVYCIFVRTQKRSEWGRTIGVALSSAALLLLRMSSVIFVIPLLLLWTWKSSASAVSRRVISSALVLAFLAAVVAPHLVHNYRLSGDPFLSVNMIAAWHRNYEFVILKGVGCEGCATPAEMERDWFAGVPTTSYDYFFKMHTISELTSGLARGYASLYLKHTDLFKLQVGAESFILYMFYLGGVGFILLSHHRAMLGVILLLANFIPFVVILPSDPRVGVHTAPFVAFIVAYGLWWALGRSVRLGTMAVPSLSVASTPVLSRRAWFQ